MIKRTIGITAAGLAVAALSTAAPAIANAAVQDNPPHYASQDSGGGQHGQSGAQEAWDHHFRLSHDCARVLRHSPFLIGTALVAVGRVPQEARRSGEARELKESARHFLAHIPACHDAFTSRHGDDGGNTDS